MGTGSVLVKGHHHLVFGITGLGGGQRMTAALPRMQGESLQRQTTEQQQCRCGEGQRQNKPPLLWVRQTHPK